LRAKRRVKVQILGKCSEISGKCWDLKVEVRGKCCILMEKFRDLLKIFESKKRSDLGNKKFKF
jgi:hypothetical protein